MDKPLLLMIWRLSSSFLVYNTKEVNEYNCSDINTFAATLLVIRKAYRGYYKRSFVKNLLFNCTSGKPN